jgi:hypothetical protein
MRSEVPRDPGMTNVIDTRSDNSRDAQHTTQVTAIHTPTFHNFLLSLSRIETLLKEHFLLTQ